METKELIMTLNRGDIAPHFILPTDDNTSFNLHDLKGKKVILYFYPKDNTPGCTKEACDFRDHYQVIQEKGVSVLGISKDSAATHAKFKAKYHLPFPLLVDKAGDVCEAYGVIHKKSLWGKTFLGIHRSTFLIDEQGKIAAIWRNVKVSGHLEQILHVLNT